MKLLKLNTLTEKKEEIDPHDAFDEISKDNYAWLEEEHDIHIFNDFVRYFEEDKRRVILFYEFVYIREDSLN
ncbi:hypothetical protein ES705_35067 [subsurface metagenome]